MLKTWPRSEPHERNGNVGTARRIGVASESGGRGHQSAPEDVVTEWVGRGAAEPALECACDDELLALCEAALPSATQNELSDLLARNRESLLDARERHRLDELLASYRRSLVLKAKAWQQAVARGLKPPLSDAAE